MNNALLECSIVLLSNTVQKLNLFIEEFGLMIALFIHPQRTMIHMHVAVAVLYLVLFQLIDAILPFWLPCCSPVEAEIIKFLDTFL